MLGLKTLKAEIRFILENHPETRDSNEKLYAAYLSRHGIGAISMVYFLTHFSEYDVSDFESVTRCRRKIVEEEPQFGPSEKIKELRYEKQVDIYDFIKGR